jgi:SAM-dependent methyltransferase
MLRENNDPIPYERNRKEINIIKKLLDFSSPRNILDIGCGYGRWAVNLENYISYYDGIDYSESYINVARETFKGKHRFHFIQMPAENITREIFPGDYDLIIINGLCMYLNDSVLYSLMSILNNFVANNTNIYLRESVSVIGKRLTLKDFPSKELNTEYNAIYRTPEEYEELIADRLSGMKIKSSEFFLTPETGAKEETNQKYWFLSSE